MPRGETRAVRVRAFGGEGGGLRCVPYAARQREPHAPGASRGAVPVFELPRKSGRCERAAQPPQLSDARRLHSLSLQHSRIELRRQLPALRAPMKKTILALSLIGHFGFAQEG